MLDAIFKFCILIKWFCTGALQQSVKLTGKATVCVCVCVLNLQFYLHTHSTLF